MEGYNKKNQGYDYQEAYQHPRTKHQPHKKNDINNDISNYQFNPITEYSDNSIPIHYNYFPTGPNTYGTTIGNAEFNYIMSTPR